MSPCRKYVKWHGNRRGRLSRRRFKTRSFLLTVSQMHIHVRQHVEYARVVLKMRRKWNRNVIRVITIANVAFGTGSGPLGSFQQGSGCGVVIISRANWKKSM